MAQYIELYFVGIAVGVLVVIFTHAHYHVINFLSKLIRYRFTQSVHRFQFIFKIIGALMNIMVALVLVNANFQTSNNFHIISGWQPVVFNGNYPNFSKEWFSEVGSILEIFLMK